MVRQRKCWQTKGKKADALEIETIENSLAGLK
jgi:hypothetical protein